MVKLKKISVTIAAIIPWSPDGGEGSCRKFDGCDRLLLETVKKNALFFRNMIKN